MSTTTPVAERFKRHMRKGERRSKRTVLLKGPSGSGKTYQYRKMVEHGLKGLYVDVEAKVTSVDDLDPDLWVLRAVDVPLTAAEKQSMVADGSSAFIDLCDYVRTCDHGLDFIYFDSLMRYADELVNYLKYTKKLTGFDLWGVFGEKMRVVLKLLTSLASGDHAHPVHVIGTWGVEVGVDWQGKRAIQPIVDGKMVGPRIDYAWDDVLMLQKREEPATGKVTFVAYTGGTHEFSAKVSAGPAKLPAIIENPDLGAIIEQLTPKERSNG